MINDEVRVFVRVTKYPIVLVLFEQMCVYKKKIFDCCCNKGFFFFINLPVRIVR
jgi:hypothetical protein